LPPDENENPEPKRLPPLLRRAWYSLNQAFGQRTAHLGITPDQYSSSAGSAKAILPGLTQRQLTTLMASDPHHHLHPIRGWSRGPSCATTSANRRAHRVKLLPEAGATSKKARRLALELQNEILGALPPERGKAFLLELEAIAHLAPTRSRFPPPENAGRNRLNPI